MDKLLGINLTNDHNLASPAHILGTRFVDQINGKEYVYCRANAAIAQYDACKLVYSTSYPGYNIAPSSATTSVIVGVAHAAISSGYYGWLQVKGLCTVKSGDITSGKMLLGSATAGTVADYANTDVTVPVLQAQADDSGGVCVAQLFSGF